MATFIHSFKENLFSTYDVRGMAFKDLTHEDSFYFGIAFGYFLIKRRNLIKKLFNFLIGEKPKVVIGRDVTNISFEIKEKFVEGLMLTGVNVVAIGEVPAPIVYYSVSHFNCEAGVSITTSYLENNLSGIKFILNEESLDGEEIIEFSRVLANGVSIPENQKGVVNEIDILETYLTEMLSVLQFNIQAKLRVGINCLSSAAGKVISSLIKRLPFEFFIKSESLPYGGEEFKEKQIENLAGFTHDNNLDVAFIIDGDGDKLFAYTKNGKRLGGDEIGYIIAREFLLRKGQKNKNIVLDIGYSIEVEKALSGMGGKIFISATGKSNIRKKMEQTKAEIGIESRGSIYIKDGFYGYDDGIFAILKVLSILSFESRAVEEILSDLPPTFKTNEIRVQTKDEEQRFNIIRKRLIQELNPEKIIEQEGVKMIFSNNSAALTIRVCNTEDAISFKAEAKEKSEFIYLKKLIEKVTQEILL